MKRSVKVAIIGGSGFWSEISHHKHILEIRKQNTISITAIVDPVDPRKIKHHTNLQQMLELDNIEWVDPTDFKDEDAIIKYLIDTYDINLVIISSTPCTHYKYGVSTIKHRINTICDKPIISHDNASTDLMAAQLIIEQYDVLLDAYAEAKRDTPTLLFHSILRRRALQSFVRVAEDVKEVYEETGAGINNMTIVVNGGKYKLPAELDKPGAHGYLEGIGSISHSAYHYLDIMAWYLDNAPGRAVYIRPRLNYVFRISDYIKAQSYLPLANIIDEDRAALATPALSKATLGCELNAGFTFDLLDKDDNLVGSSSFLFNLMSFSPRTIKYDKNVHEPADKKGGGRMSHVIMDVHQDGLQGWQITKNDIVFEDNSIHAMCRRHPMLGKEVCEVITDANAYTSGVTLEDMLRVVIETISEDRGIESHPIIRSLEEERLATQLYGFCYQLIAANYINMAIDLPKIAIRD
jgi:hypothetical protein